MYGWGGYGGSVFLWDPRTELGYLDMSTQIYLQYLHISRYAYVPTYLAWYDREKQRGVGCLQAVYQCLKEQKLI